MYFNDSHVIKIKSEHKSLFFISKYDDGVLKLEAEIYPLYHFMFALRV